MDLLAATTARLHAGAACRPFSRFLPVRLIGGQARIVVKFHLGIGQASPLPGLHGDASRAHESHGRDAGQQQKTTDE